MKQQRVKSSATLGASYVVLSSIFYASYGIWTKLMGNFFGGYTASALRSALVLLILGSLAIKYRQLEKINWKDNWRYLVGLILTAVLIWGPLYFAILNAGVGISLALNYASIVIGMFLFGRLLAGERFTKDKWLSAALGLTGVWLVFLPSVSKFGWIALGAALLSGFSSSAHYVIAKKIPYNATQSTLSMWAASLIANTVMALILTERIPALGIHPQWGYLIIFSFASVASTWLFVRGVKIIDAGAAGVLGLLEIVFGVLFGAVFFGERPGVVVLLGVAIIVSAAAIPYLKDYNAKRGTLG
jgi:S-adenosylmethionine uptake transporter